jgi:GH15 family glucan-1,4-alpha-glucosidase
LRNGSDEHQVRRSVDAILNNQDANGAIIASPDFAQYGFCWLRDASFSAYALDLAGEHAASTNYHLWVNRAVTGIAGTIDHAIAARLRGDELGVLEMPPARFSLGGTTVVDDWPNFQIDGYGTWLWSLGRHLELAGSTGLPDEYVDSVARVARYLATFSLSPCYDVWEENGSDRHTSTLACVYGGLSTAARLLNNDDYVASALEVKEHVLAVGESSGYYVKSSANSDVDASTLWLTEPFGVVDADDEYFAATVALIEDRLTLNGGIRRYPTDVYFGSGAWPVLTASIGWHYVGIGNRANAERCRQWIADHFDEEARLGEQYDGDLRDPLHYEEWVARWGRPAIDLTWSHAMYVVLCLALEGEMSSGDPASIGRERDARSR